MNLNDGNRIIKKFRLLLYNNITARKVSPGQYVKTHKIYLLPENESEIKLHLNVLCIIMLSIIRVYILWTT